ncbi:MAG TPA: ArsR family transcriptional regulator [Solirubrobacterales bacterium]
MPHSRSNGGKGRKDRSKRRSQDLLNYKQMHALSNEDRVRIFAILCERVASPKEISGELNEGLSQVSYHVSVLRECELIELDGKKQRRGAVEHFYRAAAPTLIPPDAWKHLPVGVRKTISMGILQEFFEDAYESIEAGVFDTPPGELSWTPLILDGIGLDEFGEIARDFLEAVVELQSKASKRLANANGKAVNGTAATIFLASFISARSSQEGKKASAAKRR